MKSRTLSKKTSKENRKFRSRIVEVADETVIGNSQQRIESLMPPPVPYGAVFPVKELSTENRKSSSAFLRARSTAASGNSQQRIERSPLPSRTPGLSPR